MMLFGWPQELLGAELIAFREPVLLWALLAPPVLVLLLPKAHGRERLRNFLSLVLRVVGLWALILAAARPYVSKEVPDLSLTVAVDGSASMSEARLQDVLGVARRYTSATEMPVAWVGLGQELSLEEGGPSRADPARGTDLAALVDLAVLRAPPARSRRVLLLSDGADTRQSAEVERVLESAASAGAAGVEIHAVPPGIERPQRSLLGVEGPMTAEAGERVELTARIFASEAGQVELRLEVDGSESRRQQLELREGTQEIALSLKAPAAGTHRLELALEPSDDWPEDDRRARWLVTTTDGPVLVHGPRAESVVRSLRRGGQSAREVGAIPRSVPEGAALFLLAPDMEKWDQGLPERLQRMVRDEGLDLLIAGGPQGLGSDETWMDPLDRTLPVVFPDKKKRQPPPLAVAYVIDRSDSMARSQKLDLAVAAVAQSVEMLTPDARVGVLTFSDRFEWTVPMTRAKNKAAILEAIDTIRVSGGTSIYPALQEAYEALLATDALVRHVIVLTDGRGTTRYDQHLKLMDAIHGSPVSVSTVALSAEAARDELQKVADRGKGRAYYTESFEDLPSIFVDETMTLLRKNAVEQDDTVRAVAGSPLVGSQDWSAVPLLGGHNEARPKPTADLGLVMGDRSRPLLASWRYGLGSATVFTSELGGGWGGRWLEWGGYSPWLAELVEAMRRRPPSDELALDLRGDEEGLSVVLTALDVLGSPREELELELRVLGDGGERAVALQEEVPGRYTARLDWDGALLVSATVPGGRGTPAGVVRAQAAPPPPRELAGRLTDIELLERIARAGGGELLPDPERLLVSGVRGRDEEREHWPWLLAAGLVLLVLEIAARRALTPR